MANYTVKFQINGTWHQTTGKSSYPTKELVENNSVDNEILERTAYIFIGEYKKQHKINGDVNYRTVTFIYTLED